MFEAEALVCALRGISIFSTDVQKIYSGIRFLSLPFPNNAPPAVDRNYDNFHRFSFALSTWQLDVGFCCVVRLKRMEIGKTLHTLAVKLLLREWNLNFAKI